jgi:hypothetical protein
MTRGSCISNWPATSRRWESELVHTDKREMQRQIAADARRLREILARIPAS